jgi:hypothetical protein
VIATGWHERYWDPWRRNLAVGHPVG